MVVVTYSHSHCIIPIQGAADNPKVNAIVVIRGSVDGKLVTIKFQPSILYTL